MARIKNIRMPSEFYISPSKKKKIFTMDIPDAVLFSNMSKNQMRVFVMIYHYISLNMICTLTNYQISQQTKLSKSRVSKCVTFLKKNDWIFYKNYTVKTPDGPKTRRFITGVNYKRCYDFSEKVRHNRQQNTVDIRIRPGVDNSVNPTEQSSKTNVNSVTHTGPLVDEHVRKHNATTTPTTTNSTTNNTPSVLGPSKPRKDRQNSVNKGKSSGKKSSRPLSISQIVVWAKRRGYMSDEIDEAKHNVMVRANDIKQPAEYMMACLKADRVKEADCLADSYIKVLHIVSHYRADKYKDSIVLSLIRAMNDKGTSDGTLS